VDWSWERHAVCVVDDAGEVADRFDVHHGRRGLEQMTSRLRSHGVERVADGAVFRSLQRAGVNRAALLLAEIGDCRSRFPDESSLAAAAGVAPSTRASGKRRAVSFRRGCDKQLRAALIDFAQDSVQASPWARDIYDRARSRGCRHPHAVRIVARAWVRVIWRCWTDGFPYDPARHEGAIRIAA
jgi:transposase